MPSTTKLLPSCQSRRTPPPSRAPSFPGRRAHPLVTNKNDRRKTSDETQRRWRTEESSSVQEISANYATSKCVQNQVWVRFFAAGSRWWQRPSAGRPVSATRIHFASLLPISISIFHTLECPVVILNPTLIPSEWVLKSWPFHPRPCAKRTVTLGRKAVHAN